MGRSYFLSVFGAQLIGVETLSRLQLFRIDLVVKLLQLLYLGFEDELIVVEAFVALPRVLIFRYDLLMKPLVPLLLVVLPRFELVLRVACIPFNQVDHPRQQDARPFINLGYVVRSQVLMVLVKNFDYFLDEGWLDPCSV